MEKDYNKNTEESSNDTIRVNIGLLDDLMTYAGELVLARNQLLRITNTLSNQIPGLPAVLQDVNLTTTILQEKIMNTRMQAISLVFSKFPRLIRDVHQVGSKKINFEIQGNDVNLDKSVIEKLYEPLLILISYLIESDIEDCEYRIDIEKEETASLILKAYSEGGKVNIDIISDGLGLDTEEITERCIKAGIINADEAKKLTEKEIKNLVFSSDIFKFKTKIDNQTKELSLKDAKNLLEKIGGTVNIDSEYGISTIIRVKLPQTLVIIPSIIIRVNDQNFAIPQISLQEIERIKKGDTKKRIERVNNAPVLRLRNKLLPIVYLREVLEMKETSADGDTTKILVLKQDEHQFGLVVDEIYDHEEIVVKNLPGFFNNTLCYSGTTIMGDGSVSLILDVNGITRKSKLNFSGLQEKNKITDIEDKTDDDLQSLLIFENAKDQYFALNLDLIKRIEKIKNTDIDKVGQKEYIEHEGKSLSVIRLEHFLPVNVPQNDNDFIYVIIPKAVENPVGIICHKIVDSYSVNVRIDTESIISKGLIGSSLINDRLILFPDIYELIEMAEPEKIQKNKHKEANKTKILLVEDTPFFRTLEKNYFESAGYKVDIAIDGQDGLKKAEKAEYDLFIVDLIMPGLDGYQFVEHIRKNEKLKNIPAIALTTLTSDESKERAFKAGFDAYEIKLHKEKLLETMQKILTKEIL